MTLREIDVTGLIFSRAVMRNTVLKRLTGVADAKWVGVDLSDSRMDRSVWESLPDLVREMHSGSVTIDD